MDPRTAVAREDAPERPDLSVVLPVYRSKDTLPALCERINEAFASTTAKLELVLVEDCGRNGSWEVIEKLAQTLPGARGIRLIRNFGQHAATICGMALSGGQWVATIDDDLEQPPEKLPELLLKAKQGYDLVYGIYPERTHAVCVDRLFSIAVKHPRGVQLSGQSKGLVKSLLLAEPVTFGFARRG